MDSDYPVTRRYAMTRAAVSLAKRAAKAPKSVTGQYAAVVGDVGIGLTAASKAAGPSHASRLAREHEPLLEPSGDVIGERLTAPGEAR